ncbi:uncharacterized protein N7483_006607 [Penicillium malachiteum]|uniref:uncharacterized protein n=1 Tax=Penicillium malachiteum TaxID=1324776 RepID=UPI00254863F1|nr:uncharacterized protein N7483_006607 [Penicillium malachiteum]KAJ5725250.1 hypothetical protein N7483_006607 [Penicillium malachiteum]
MNFVAIVPSSRILGLATDELGVYMDKSSLLLALIIHSFGNAVQLIQSILPLKNRQLSILRLSLLGTILSNLLLLTGICFLLGGIRYFEQRFNREKTETITILLFLAVLSLVIPTASHYLSNTDAGGILAQSRGTSIIIMISSGLWLLFDLKTHRELWDTPPLKPTENIMWRKRIKEGDVGREIAKVGHVAAKIGAGAGDHRDVTLVELIDDSTPRLTIPVIVVTMLVTTTLIALNTNYATDSIQGLTDQYISPSFVGLVILPIISLDTAAVKYAVNGNMDIAISLTLGRCMQNALMYNDFFIAIIILGYVVREGRSNW